MASSKGHEFGQGPQSGSHEDRRFEFNRNQQWNHPQHHFAVVNFSPNTQCQMASYSGSNSGGGGPPGYPPHNNPNSYLPIHPAMQDGNLQNPSRLENQTGMRLPHEQLPSTASTTSNSNVFVLHPPPPPPRPPPPPPPLPKNGDPNVQLGPNNSVAQQCFDQIFMASQPPSRPPPPPPPPIPHPPPTMNSLVPQQIRRKPPTRKAAPTESPPSRKSKRRRKQKQNSNNQANAVGCTSMEDLASNTRQPQGNTSFPPSLSGSEAHPILLDDAEPETFTDATPGEVEVVDIMQNNTTDPEDKAEQSTAGVQIPHNCYKTGNFTDENVPKNETPAEVVATMTPAIVVADASYKSATTIACCDGETSNATNPKDVSRKEKSHKEKLELLKAKVEVAKKRKLAAESKNVPEVENGSIQAKLHAARAKLRGALKNRKKALQKLGPAGPPPMPGLSTSSIQIDNISKTGPPEKVYFPYSSLGYDLGRKELSQLLVSEEVPSESLSERKMRLQQELLALKERLEHTQKSPGDEEPTAPSKINGMEGTSENSSPKQRLSKEELERRKEQAQAFMDISYWKHFVSKQEHLLSSVNKQVEDNTRATEEHQEDFNTTRQQLQAAQENISELEERERVIDCFISKATDRVLESRQELHSAVDSEKVKQDV